jgi:hypothetical protein
MDENQLAQLYQQYLGRAPDPSGIATWSGQDPSTVIAGILGSQEYQSRSGGGGGGEPIALPVGGETIMPVGDAQSNLEKVDQLYRSILGRSAKDDPASQGWVTLLESGASLENIASAIGSSQEAQNKALSGVSEEIKTNDPNNFAGKVTELYASALGRTPEPKALEEYVNILNRNPDEFGWLTTHVTSSPEAQKYAEKTGVDLNLVRENAVSGYGKWTPAASSPTPGGLGGLFMKYGPYLPFVAAAAASAPGLLAAEGAAAGGAAGTAAGGAAAGGAAGTAATGTGLSGLYSSLPAWGQAALKGAAIGGGVGGGVAGLTGGNVGQSILRGALIGGATGGITQGLSGISAPTEPSLFSSDLAELAKTYPGLSEQQLIDIANINYGVDTFTAADAARLASNGYSPATIDQVLGYSYNPSELSGTGITSMTSAGTSLFDTAGKILSSPLGRLGVMGGLSLLGGGGQQQAPIPQMAGGGGGTYAPKGMVDYTPILNLLAPRQIGRNSLLG